MRLETQVKLGTAKVCGAHARSTGKPCQCKQVYRSGRCKFHGGLSTGPRTPEGKQRAIKAMHDGLRRSREQKTAQHRVTRKHTRDVVLCSP